MRHVTSATIMRSCFATCCSGAPLRTHNSTRFDRTTYKARPIAYMQLAARVPQAHLPPSENRDEAEVMTLHQNFIAGSWTDGPEAGDNINPSDAGDIVGRYAR